MMKAKYICIAYLIMLAGTYPSLAQQFQYSLYSYAIQKVNPASISQDSYATAQAIYRSQQSLAGVSLQSALFSAKYPFVTKKRGRWSAAGVTVGQDNAGLGGALQLNEVGGSYALSLLSNRLTELSIGAQATYKSRRINTAGLVTGNQYLEDVGFDPSMHPGENWGDLAASYVSLSTGVSWQGFDRAGKRLSNLAISVLDINTPDESVLEGRFPFSAPLTLVLEVGQRIWEKRKFSIYSEVLYLRAGQTNLLNIGTVARYQVDRFTRANPGRSIDFYTKYLMNTGAMTGVRWNNGRILSLGVCYEIPLNRHPAHQGAFEVAVQLEKLVKAKTKRKRPGKKVPPRTRITRTPPSSTDRPDSIQLQIEKVELPPDTLKMAPDPDFPQPEPTLPEKVILRYDFEFGETRPVLEKESIVTEIVDVMTQNPGASIEIIGHTDSVGSAKFNQILSEERARVFFELLTELGVDATRMDYYGEGEFQPLNDNSTEEFRRLNRRVEVVFHYNKEDR